MKYVFYLAASLLAATGVLFLKKIDLNIFIREGLYVGIAAVLSNKFFWIGMLLYGGAFLFFLIIINGSNSSASVPALLSVYIITLGVFGYVAGEDVSAQQLIAYVLLLAGISLL